MALRSPRGTDYLHKKNKGRLYEPALVLWEAQVTKIYRPIVPSQLAEQLNTAFDSAEPHTICREIGRALTDFNVSEIAKEAGLQRTSITGLSAVIDCRTLRPSLRCWLPWACT